MNTERLAGLLGEATALPWRPEAGDDYQISADAYPNTFKHRFKGDDTGSALAVFGNRPSDFGMANRDLAVEAVNTLPTLLSRLAALEEALKPFADACTISTYGDDEVIDDCLAANKITHGDLRRARATLAQAVAGEGRDNGIR